MIVEGAFAEVLGTRASIRGGDSDLALDDTAPAALRAIFETRRAEGYHVLAVATRSFPPRPDYDRADKTAMTFRGFLVFQDPPRPTPRGPSAISRGSASASR
jgi:Mg2+-importing ATPase